MGLSAEGLSDGGLYAGKKMESETTDTLSKNANFYLENEENLSYYSSICSFKKFVPEIVPLWLKNRNQRVHTAYARVGGI